MIIGSSHEKSALKARRLVIWAEELCNKRRYAAAEVLYQRALRLGERTLGRQHPVRAEILEYYADLLAKTNRLAEGTVMRRRSEAIWDTCFPRSDQTGNRSHPVAYPVEPEGSD